MSKKTYFVLFLIIIGLSSYYNFDKLIKNKTIEIFNNTKQAYIEKLTSIENKIEKHFRQSKKIEELNNEIKELEKYKYLYTDIKSRYDNTVTFKDQNTSAEELFTVKVLSYAKFNDFTKVYIDTEDINITEDTIGGLIVDDYAAGILIKDEGKSVALLNGNIKSNYAVYIGKDKAPGITHSLKYKKNIVVKFIPNWLEIEVGDEVVTSGMDGIFFEGLKVGKVVSVRRIGDTQEAVVEPYADISNDSLYYLYYKNKGNI